MSNFYNPYQFVPVTGQRADQPVARSDYAEVASGTATGHAASARHDLWHPAARSGRIICSLYLDTPLVVGGGQSRANPNQAARVHQYRWRGTEAIPANSLKGMVSSIAEALSQSALRILSDAPISLRITDRTSPHGTRRVTLGLTARDYFNHIDANNPDLLPWYKDRNQLTPAELLFGAVEVNERDANPDQGRNLAGRLRFHDALPARTPVVRLPETTLRILDSPKLPCPSMYFHLRDQRGGWFSKDDLYHKQTNTDILPNGRKFYLHHRQAGAQDWQTRDSNHRAKNKLRCAPIAAGQTFFFAIDFDNLSAAELTLLEYALAPGPGFRHRLGLGKPLGLGSVTVGVEGVYCLDPHQRYSLAALTQPAQRYHDWWRPNHTPLAAGRVSDFSQFHPQEWATTNGQPPAPKPSQRTDDALLDAETLAVLLTLGDPKSMRADCAVHTPLTPRQQAQGGCENELFRWFNDNDEAGAQALRPVVPGAPLPPLYADPAQANRAGVCFSPTVGALATAPEAPPGPVDAAIQQWLADNLPAGERVQSKAVATEVVAITDPDLRLRVFQHICRRCARENDLLDNPADRLYRKHKLQPNYD